MSQNKSYYDILGVGKDASEEEIKKQYRKLSLQYHPDRNNDPNAESIFKEINEAHETLSDSDKRRQYDMQGQGMPFPFPGGMGQPEFHDMNDIFRQFFGGGGGPPMPGHGGMPGVFSFSMGGPPGQQDFHFFHGGGEPGMGFPGGIFQNLHKPPPIIKTLKLTLEQAYFGGSFPIEISKWVVRNNVKHPPEIQTIHVTVPPGIDENEVIVLREMGNAIENSISGDVKICIEIIGDSVFQRQGLDLIYNHTLTLKEALCGFKFDLKHLNNKTLSFNNHTNVTVIKPGYKKVVPQLGMNKQGQTGNLILQFDIVFPDSLSSEQIRILSDAL